VGVYFLLRFSLIFSVLPPGRLEVIFPSHPPRYFFLFGILKEFSVWVFPSMVFMGSFVVFLRRKSSFPERFLFRAVSLDLLLFSPRGSL